jgi:isopenicillin-N N-acyltransferase-like protein
VTAARLVDLPADPAARGEAHGEALRDLIAEAFARWHDSLAIATGEDPHAWIRTFLADSDHRPAIERWAPSFLVEIDGIARGAGVDADEMYAFQLVDEQWSYEARRKANRAPEHEHCSTLGIRAHGEAGGMSTIVAQNLDLPPWWDGLQTVLRIADGEQPGVVLVTAAGFITMNGMSADVAIGVNALPDVPSTTTGLPVAFAIRQALLEPTAELAVSYLESVTHASGQSYIVGDRTETIGIEADADGTTRFGKGEDAVLHTNHAIHRPSGERGQSLAAAALANTTARLAALEGAELRDVETVTSALSCAPVLRVPTKELGGITFATCVFELGDTAVAHVRGGPGETDFLTIQTGVT